jgi:SAM-dependent methyltransferase
MNQKIEKSALKSHIAHENHMINLINEKDKRLFLLKNKDCVAYFLNVRTLDILNPLFNKNNTWLTIGDFNGFEAKYFKEKNQIVTASDISDAFLKEAKTEGLIDVYSKENVEHLSFEEESFDYVSCREAYHHFPRAYLGLYEMIRVAKKGVIVIEPVDIISKMPLLLFLKNVLDLFNPFLINKIWKNRFSWEKVGNYVFKISDREVEKIAMGLGLPYIAFKEMNVLFNINQDIEEVPTNQKVLRKVKQRLRKINAICKLRLIPFNTLCSIIFKEMPDENTIEALKLEGYRILKLPENPYLK